MFQRTWIEDQFYNSRILRPKWKKNNNNKYNTPRFNNFEQFDCIVTVFSGLLIVSCWCCSDLFNDDVELRFHEDYCGTCYFSLSCCHCFWNIFIYFFYILGGFLFFVLTLQWIGIFSICSDTWMMFLQKIELNN